MLRRVTLVPLSATYTIYTVNNVGAVVTRLNGLSWDLVNSFLRIPLRRGYSRYFEREGKR